MSPRMSLYMFYTVVKFQTPSFYSFLDMNFFLVWIFVKLHPDRQKAMHMSPPCKSTGGLKKVNTFLTKINHFDILNT